jgi:hypothetical protein
MADETQPDKTDWQSVPKETIGEVLLGKCDPDLTALTEDQRAKILVLSRDSTALQLLQIYLGDTVNPNIGVAYDVFSFTESIETEILPVLLLLRFYAMFQCMYCIDDNRKMLKRSSLKGSDRNTANRIAVDAVSRMDIMLDKTLELSREIAKHRKSEIKPKPVAAIGIAPDLE